MISLRFCFSHSKFIKPPILIIMWFRFSDRLSPREKICWKFIAIDFDGNTPPMMMNTILLSDIIKDMGKFSIEFELGD